MSLRLKIILALAALASAASVAIVWSKPNTNHSPPGFTRSLRASV